ncbi:hypothetical protein [Rhodococcus sp. KRD162]|nr:hypothetical protein [Rhodococcus sp. KRD162]
MVTVDARAVATHVADIDTGLLDGTNTEHRAGPNVATLIDRMTV